MSPSFIGDGVEFPIGKNKKEANMARPTIKGKKTKLPGIKGKKEKLPGIKGKKTKIR